MKTYNWTTAKGARIELTIGERTYTESIADGAIEREGRIKEAAEIRVDGGRVDSPRLALNGEKLYFTIGGRNAETEIPEEIRGQIWREERARADARLGAELKAEEEYQKHAEIMRKAMAE